MGAKSLLKKLDFSPGNDLSYLKKESKSFVLLLKDEIFKSGIEAEVIVGGSFAKGTLIRKELYDIDIFVRFDWKIDDISTPLEKALKEICKNRYKLTKVHGSRDYFRAEKNKNLVFEIIPVTKISKPSEARNVTDLSYFHVNYIKRKLSRTNLAREILFAKAFCKAQKAYGAESYIRGFSGYGLECLIIHYKTFEKMARELSKAKERIIIDIEKRYKRKSDVLFELNESKLGSPIILIDPTWKERNALAALSYETFKIFQKSLKDFLRKPSERFFFESKIDEDKLIKEAKKKKVEFVHVRLRTDRQPGDIAGTKLKKFSDFLAREISFKRSGTESFINLIFSRRALITF